MIELVEKDVQCVQFSDVTLEFLSEFYAKKDNQTKVLLVYNKDRYYTNIGYEEARKFSDGNELLYFLVACAKEKSIAGDRHATVIAEKKFQISSYIDYILLEDSVSKKNKANFYSNIIEIREQYKDTLWEVGKNLREKGIHTYFVKIPEINDLASTAKHQEWEFENFAAPINWTASRKKVMVRYLQRFTELGYEEARKKILYKNAAKSWWGTSETKCIYLVGPCIVAGWESFLGEELGSVLYDTLRRMEMGYRVISVVTGRLPELNNKKILEYDIKQNDIVIFLEDVIDYDMADLTLDHIYNSYRGEKWLYADLPIHTTYTANKLIASELKQDLIEPIVAISDKTFDDHILHKGEMQLTYEESDALGKYLDSLIKYNSQQCHIIGACVMTCNPFTCGHYHLIEYASRQVELLYVFVVEEDAVFFPFADRIEMVRQGVRNIKNVIVLPSGRFMISKITFKNYFEKEQNQETVIDASKDIMIFKRYIAPALGITKRFVGEEPDDNVTYQYNQALKRDLSEEIEVIEIPRRKVAGEIISASRVRKYLGENSLDEIGGMVPASTLNYLKEHVERLGKKEAEDESLNRVIDFIRCHDQIVICGLGNEAVKLMQRLRKRLTAAEYSKLVFYDKKASHQQYCFEGKSVIRFQELITEYRDYYMLIATWAFRKDIVCSLIAQKIDPEHIMVAFP